MRNNLDFKQITLRAKEGETTCDIGGCALRAVPGSKYCGIHGNSPQPESLYKFEKSKIALRLAEIRKHPDSQNLEVELGLIRHLLENIINKCNDEMDFIQNSGQITQLVDKIQLLLKTNVHVGQVTKQLLSIEEVVTIAQQLVSIVSEYVDLDDLQEISERFEQCFVPKSS